MKKKFRPSRLFLSLLFLALFALCIVAVFSTMTGMVFSGKHADLLRVSEREYIDMVKNIRDVRIESGWIDDELSEEKTIALNSYAKERLREMSNRYYIKTVQAISASMLLGMQNEVETPEAAQARNAKIQADMEDRDGLSAFTVQIQNEMISKVLDYTNDSLDVVLLRYRVYIFILAGLIGIASLYMLKKYSEYSRHYLLAFMSLVWLIPIIWLVACAFSADRGPNISRFFPETWTLNNFKELLLSTDQVAQYPMWFKNSFTIAICNCIVSSTFVLMVAYTMSCMRFRARKSLMNFAIILNLFPGFLTMIAIYFVMKTLNMTNNNIGLIVVYSASSGLGYLIAKGYFDTVPKSLREAAKIEGASENIVFWRIVVPLSKPIIVYTVIGAFLSPWMDFIFANIMLNKGISENKTVAIGLYAMTNKVNINEYFGRFCAGGLLVSIPISALFIVMQKFYIEGVTGGSVKG